VFPQFATTKADLVCDGVLPIDQMREYRGPVGLVTRRISRAVLESTYGLTIRRRGAEEGGDGSEDVLAEDLLVAYASECFPRMNYTLRHDIFQLHVDIHELVRATLTRHERQGTY